MKPKKEEVKKPTKKPTKKRKFTIINDWDGNDSFTVMATDTEDAAHKALKELGWWVAAN